MKAYLYLDSRLRDILYVPTIFKTICSKRKEPEVVLDLQKLRRIGSCFKRPGDQRSLENGLGAIVDIEQKDIDIVIDLVFKDQIKQAEDYCLDIFDQVYNKVYDSHVSPRIQENGDYDSYWWQRGEEPNFNNAN